MNTLEKMLADLAYYNQQAATAKAQADAAYDRGDYDAYDILYDIYDGFETAASAIADALGV